jgi:hypothetical protein
MASTLEQLCKGEVSEKQIQEKLNKIRHDMQARTIALTTLQEEQANDKREQKLLSKALEDFNRTKKKKKKSQYVRKSIHTIDEVFSIMGQGRITTPEGEQINTDSMRYKTFKEKGLKCVTCGLVGQYFAKEKDSKEDQNVWHFNLYGINNDGEEVLFTRDHIQPRSKGGLDILENLQTMCSICNCKKGNAWEEQ